MYLCIFPEDYYMEWKKMIRLWISEGFVAKRGGRTPEEDADSYLWELVDRNLIQMAGLKDDGIGRTGYFRIHDFLRDIILSKSKQERFVEVTSKTEPMEIRARRLCIHDQNDALIRLPQLLPIRSLLMFFLGKGESKLPDDSFNFRLLGVLDLEGAPVDSFPEQICTLLLLRHLSLRETKISNIPKSIGNLARLETLDLKYTFVAELPDRISMLQKLRHLLISRVHVLKSVEFLIVVDKRLSLPGEGFTHLSYESCGVKVTANIGGLNWLQNLYYLQVPENSEWMKGLGRLTQLRKLGLVNLKEQHWREVCSCISNMTNLLSLMLQTNESFELEYLNSPPPSLDRIHLYGNLNELPSWVSPSCLPNLKVLKLYNTRLKKDPGAYLGSLPNLVRLKLYNAFRDGVKMRVVSPGYFPSLRHLEMFHDTLGHSTFSILPNNESSWMSIASQGIVNGSIEVDIPVSPTSPHAGAKFYFY